VRRRPLRPAFPRPARIPGPPAQDKGRLPEDGVLRVVHVRALRAGELASPGEPRELGRELGRRVRELRAGALHEQGERGQRPGRRDSREDPGGRDAPGRKQGPGVRARGRPGRARDLRLLPGPPAHSLLRRLQDERGCHRARRPPEAPPPRYEAHGGSGRRRRSLLHVRFLRFPPSRDRGREADPGGPGAPEARDVRPRPHRRPGLDGDTRLPVLRPRGAVARRGGPGERRRPLLAPPLRPDVPRDRVRRPLGRRVHQGVRRHAPQVRVLSPVAGRRVARRLGDLRGLHEGRALPEEEGRQRVPQGFARDTRGILPVGAT